MKHLAEWRVTKGISGVPKIFTHNTALATFHLWDLLGRSSHFGANLEGPGIFFLTCSTALNTSYPSTKILGCTVCPYALAIFCRYLWLLLLATSCFSSSPSKSANLPSACFSSLSSWISSSTTLNVGTVNSTRLITSVPYTKENGENPIAVFGELLQA